ncbi:lysylphosphatidylglycerol synthase transmembrane domain-containing protein [Pseudonocardia ailaonensis]|uniref:Lysylphosphatidylglycerol synthase transmembrane domain-containing protein n=1 Tax=Pseudonocardia ailaonensis TaxID=367279 RepID=A0ABN2MQB8_9PSEU
MLAGVVVLGVVAWRVDLSAVLAAVRGISVPALLTALGLGMGTTLAAAGRWWVVARGLGLPLRMTTAVAATYRATLLNSVLPAGVLGDVHRAVRYGREVGDVGRGARAVAIERVAGQAAIVVVGLGVVLASPGVREQLRAFALPASVLLLAVGLVAVLARGRLARHATALRADLRTGVLAHWPAVLGLSVLALAGYLALFVVAARSAGVAAPLGTLLPLLVLGLLAMALPVTIGGWGPREGVLSLAFGAVGLGAAQGLATAVVYGVLALVACLPGVAAPLFLRAPAREPERSAS